MIAELLNPIVLFTGLSILELSVIVLVIIYIIRG